MTKQKTILLSFILSLPVVLFLLHHYFYHAPGLQPTGFTVDENVLYMSYARQYVDADSFQLFYSNPFDGDPQSPAIYFQPVNIILAPAIAMGMDPGLCFSIFGLIMAIACIYVGLLIIRHLLPGDKNVKLISLLFIWGGGLTAFAGIAASIISPEHAYPSWLDNIFIADPANGWWGLNWGRNLFIPLEAYYHFLFLLNIYLILKKRWAASISAAFFLSISHPFTGITFLLIASAWVLVEKIKFQKREMPLWYVAGIFGVTIFHLWYYLIWLNQFPEHKKLFSQYSAGWTYSMLVAIPAYCIVLGLAVIATIKFKPFLRFTGSPHQRLFIFWAITSFLLSKHEWFIKPMQPIHFTRGYTWAGLFLLALPVITCVIGRLNERKWLLNILVLIFLADNILWTTNILRKKEVVEWEGHITSETKDVLNYLEKNSSPNDLLVGNAPLIMYLSNVYSPANTWVSHPYNTPDRFERLKKMQDYFREKIIPDSWKGRRIVIIQDRFEKQATDTIAHRKLLFSNSRYHVFTP